MKFVFTFSSTHSHLQTSFIIYVYFFYEFFAFIWCDRFFTPFLCSVAASYSALIWKKETPLLNFQTFHLHTTVVCVSFNCHASCYLILVSLDTNRTRHLHCSQFLLNFWENRLLGRSFDLSSESAFTFWLRLYLSSVLDTVYLIFRASDWTNTFFRLFRSFFPFRPSPKPLIRCEHLSMCAQGSPQPISTVVWMLSLFWVVSF